MESSIKELEDDEYTVFVHKKLLYQVWLEDASGVFVAHVSSVVDDTYMIDGSNDKRKITFERWQTASDTIGLILSGEVARLNISGNEETGSQE